MLFLTGDTRKKEFVRVLQHLGWGRMCVRDKPDPYPEEPWGFDNGAFSYYIKGELFDEDEFLKRLDKAYDVGIPHIAVTPDIVAGGLVSLHHSLLWAERLPHEWPWYLVVQDGMTTEDVEPILDSFAGIFLGGTIGFKATAREWSDLAHIHDKPFHYGRCGTLSHLQLAHEALADSCDSAFPIWCKSRFYQFVTWWINGDLQQRLFEGVR